MAPCLSELLVLVAKPAGSPKSSVVGSGFEAFSYGRFSLFGLLGSRGPVPSLRSFLPPGSCEMPAFLSCT
ncbi:hypothetical protein TcWFU_002472 [Taenia crassiceps]|uniref:Uncharacterized protein n=1 Tax=Taenia crassiceps TaxID=6207 RepID=A0ABR4QJV3_9CEST